MGKRLLGMTIQDIINNVKNVITLSKGDMMKFRSWLWKGFKNKIGHPVFILMIPCVIGSLITIKLVWGQWYWEFYMFIPLLIGYALTWFLFLYSLYELDETLS